MKRKSSAADEAAQQAAGRSTANRIQEVVVLVSPYAQGAADRVIPLARAAGGRAAPLAQSAAGRVVPLGREAARRVSPYAEKAAVLLVPYAQQAAGRVGPIAQNARNRGTHAAQEAVKAMGPKFDDAYLRITPVVVAARGKVDEELMPRVSGAWTAAAAAPVVVEATKRGKAAMAAARGELSLPEVVTKKKASWPKRLAVFSAAAGVGVMVAKRLLGSHDAEWTAAAPTTTPAPSVPDATVGADVPTVTFPVSHEGIATPAAEPVETVTYSGEGVYVGSEPPEGFVLKGDVSTKTYVAPESAAYDGSTGEIWFNSAEAAEQAGFTRAQG